MPYAPMKKLDYGKNYQYLHDFEHNFIEQQYLPDELKEESIWQSQNNGLETIPKEILSDFEKIFKRSYSLIPFSLVCCFRLFLL